ncbi:xanthine dehydrogenase accessory protein XdhC [Paracoccus aerodenitrificans]|uniref:xanthine dehydrogenase accessory protein XdhC n=1 Tax=Paracoccus aerodenitrificans TaxID=3017781 RepID=UPI0022F07CA3|nr:xanthine dehydrogenase accessory protein XdhC [Paracoccus aerodenitrificans]WBU65640.1 xanthine dehydrogenase accessory protein XdhC [Paracoccus aerodenitrificans]
MKFSALLSEFLSQPGPAAHLRITALRGSSPREVGAQMFVRDHGICGTIGGGQLEYRAIAAARKMLAAGDVAASLDLPLGPEIGQCCGGRVEILATRMSERDKNKALLDAQADDDALPSVYILGAGHVGRALADQFQHLPVRSVLVDQRREELSLNRAEVETRLSAIPEFEIMTALPGSAFIVLTHDHGLDFLLASAALQRNDAAYVGMIGSATKLAKFRSWSAAQCGDLQADRLICPIGAQGSRDKRPAVIASFVAAEVMAALTSQPATGKDYWDISMRIAGE